MYRPSREECKRLKQNYKAIPLSKEIRGDKRTPVDLLRLLQGISKHCFLLESMEDSQNWGRYTFLGFLPQMEFSCKNGVIAIKKDNDTKIFREENPKIMIQKIMEEYQSPKLSYLPPFTGGLVGYFAFDYVKYAEPKLNFNEEEANGFPDVDMMLFDKLIVLDNQKHTIQIIVTIKTNYLEEDYEKGCLEIEEIEKIIFQQVPIEEQKGKLVSHITPLFQKEEYCNMVEKAKKHIYEGDIFQVVLSNQFSADFEGSLLETYRVLRKENPSPYLFYFVSDSLEMAGASPETLVKLEDHTVWTYPLAGTRPRGKNGAEDQRLEKELLEDEKELAEHNMLVDLGRNDLGKLCKFGSIEVERYASVVRFSQVMHIGSAVKGVMRNDKTAMDAIEAVLPAGTLCGAPKIRACEILKELEHTKRGIYGGAVGYLGFSGDMDLCIAIRLAYKKDGKVFVRSGAGIVADSNPEKEYEECIHKAKAILLALEKGNGGKEYGVTNRQL